MPIPAKSHGCTWHWLSQQDLPEIGGLIAAEEHFGDAIHHHDLPALEAAVADEAVLTLTDDRGRKVLIPASRIAYLELGQEAARRVGFGSL